MFSDDVLQPFWDDYFLLILCSAYERLTFFLLSCISVFYK